MIQKIFLFMFFLINVNAKNLKEYKEFDEQGELKKECFKDKDFDFISEVTQTTFFLWQELNKNQESEDFFVEIEYKEKNIKKEARIYYQNKRNIEAEISYFSNGNLREANFFYFNNKSIYLKIFYHYNNSIKTKIYYNSDKNVEDICFYNANQEEILKLAKSSFAYSSITSSLANSFANNILDSLIQKILILEQETQVLQEQNKILITNEKKYIQKILSLEQTRNNVNIEKEEQKDNAFEEKLQLKKEKLLIEKNKQLEAEKKQLQKEKEELEIKNKQLQEDFRLLTISINSANINN